MKSARSIRSLLFVAGLALCAPELRAHDILANGDFTQGKAHWDGDGKDAGGASIDDVALSMGDQGRATGMIVSLKASDVSYVSQLFRSPDTTLLFSISYKTSANFHAMGNAERGQDGGALGGMVDSGGPLTSILGFPVQGKLPYPGKDRAVVLIADPSQNEVIYSLFPFPASPDRVHTSTVKLGSLMAHEEKTLYIFLPPGLGDVTFSNISLNKPDAAPGSAPDNPFQQ